MDDAVAVALRDINEELQRKGYFVFRYADKLHPGTIVVDVRPLEGIKVVVIGQANAEDAEEFEKEHRHNFPELSESRRNRLHSSYPYIYRAIAE